MHSLTIVVGPTIWALLFNNKENALKQEMALDIGMNTGTAIAVSDDFGQNMHIIPSSVHGWLVEDMDQSKMAHCERMLHQERIRAQAQRLAESDAALRMGANARGPGMITPFGPHGRN